MLRLQVMKKRVPPFPVGGPWAGKSETPFRYHPWHSVPVLLLSEVTPGIFPAPGFCQEWRVSRG